jgi:hypothetical protein
MRSHVMAEVAVGRLLFWNSLLVIMDLHEVTVDVHAYMIMT